MNLFRLDQVCKINPPKDIKNLSGMEISFVPMEAVSTEGRVDTSRSISGDNVKSYSVFKNRDVLFAKITPCMENGKGGIVNNLKNGYGAGSTEFIVIRPDETKVTSEWIKMFLSQTSFRYECRNNMTGSAGQKRVPPKFLASKTIPVPPLEDQHRIVSRIEELFSQLDSGVETLKKTKEQLKVYRQAVLKEAFEAVKKDSILCNVEDVCNDIKVGIVIKPSQYYTSEDNGIGAFRSANVREFSVNDSEWVYLTNDGHQANQRSEIHTGDVLVVRSGYPGTACVVPPKYNGYNAIDILIAVPNLTRIVPDYLCAYTNSPLGRKIVQEKKRGVAQAHFNVSGYSKTPIIVPSIDIQKKVVEIIESRLSVCDSIEKTVDNALQQAEALRQSILKKAFEGEL